MVKNRKTKTAARNLKQESGITYPRALDLVRGAGTSTYPALTLGLIAGSPVNWQPRPGTRLEITGATGTGKSELMAFMATQAAAAGTKVFILDLDKRGPDYTDIAGAVVATDLDEARSLFSDLESTVRPAVVFFEGIPRLAPDMDEAREEMTAAAGRLADAGYPVVAAWQFPEPRWEGSARIFLGRSVAQQRSRFFGTEVKQGAGRMEGHFLQAGGGEPLLFELCRDGDIPGLPSGHLPRFDDLGLPQAVRGFATVAPGLYVFAGLTGSGRTTSMAAVANLITERFARRVAVLESVRELAIRPGRSKITRWDVVDSGSLAKVIDAAVGQVPDIIVIGEVNNGAAVIAAVKAAQAGHTVFMTMHAESAAHVPSRLIDMVSAEGWPEVRVALSQVLKGVLFQNLLPSEDSRMSRVPAVELFPVDDAASRMIRDSDDPGLAARVAGMSTGCISLAVSLSQLVLDGHISERTAESAMKTPMAFRRALHAGQRYENPFIVLGAGKSGEEIRSSLGAHPHLLVVGEASKRRQAIEHICSRFPGDVVRVGSEADLDGVISHIRSVVASLNEAGEGTFESLDTRPARRCIVLDIAGPHENAPAWLLELSKVSRQAGYAGVMLLIGAELKEHLDGYGQDLAVYSRTLSVDEVTSYSTVGRIPVPFTPAWEKPADAS